MGTTMTSSKYDRRDSSTQIDVTVNEGRVKVAMRFIFTVTSILATGGDNRRGSLGTKSLMYNVLDGSIQMNVTVNGGRVKMAMRFISRVWRCVSWTETGWVEQMILVPKDPCPR